MIIGLVGKANSGKDTTLELTLKDISEGKGVGVPTHLIRIKQ